MNSLFFSKACENNQAPIAEVLAQYILSPLTLLEIGSGTGQHGHYFSEHFPQLHWQPSDREDNLPMIQQWVQAAGRANYVEPFAFDVSAPPAPAQQYDCLFTANTLHIMAWPEVQAFFRLLPEWLAPQGLLFVYGPFNYDGSFSSDSNARFDLWLKDYAAHQGIRDFEAVNQLAMKQGLTLLQDHPMPANNRLLVWRREH